MSALFEPAPLAAWHMFALAALVTGAAACTVFMARKHLASDTGLPDAVFWDGFAGLAVVAPAVILPALAAPWAGLLLALVAAGTAAGTYVYAPRLFSRLEDRRTSRETLATNEAAAARHRAALVRWRRYELDPACCIDYPAMSDPACPETAALVRVMRAAELCRDTGDAGYAPAVARLEQALAEAERAAGVGGAADFRPQQPART